MPRLLAIGDIHGCCIALRTLLESVQVGANDTLVMLGDYVDRGPDSNGVLDTLIELRARTNLITLRGNHEIMMLHARDSRAAIPTWMDCGGDATFESYHATTLDDIPRSHWDFLESCVAYHEEPSHFFVHASAMPDRALADQPDTALLWEHLDVRPARHFSGKTMICGHTPQYNGLPLNWGHAVCLDTNAHDGGWLTCMDVFSGQYWQANEAGDRTRSGHPLINQALEPPR